ncbi:hypothetical protein BEP19_05265 [Ammoniphilus oxalaticus]|uniref:DUF2507 domain-containing protein n=1 Tax=Ammoniphilus oxalaticus TaxID=66863 RepID=A0A419SIQ7_9BACL|nr:DUF2507 domain-containing protein [Ammoniphilus oxalaticus]RKD23840.1 hypothetical protein BEP19_05265 [Ammoniphilus oxalaticus]
MRQSFAVSSLFKERILLPPESVSNSSLGYLFFREKLLELVLGDSETHILYWVGKELGNSLDILVTEEIEDIFLQLDLGQVHITQQTANLVKYRISHHRFNLLPPSRLEKTCYLEAGFIAGAFEKVTSYYCAAHVTLQENKDQVDVLIEVAIDRAKNLAT